jgi:mono/diheme cytochrome c family protein
MKCKSIVASAMAVALGCACSAVSAQSQVDLGQREYHSNCATCHGDSGNGIGRLYSTGFLARKPPDLTGLAARNGHVFPVQCIYAVIDGREEIAARGSSDMPVWGTEYTIEGARDPLGILDPEIYARVRILALIDYLARIRARP